MVKLFYLRTASLVLAVLSLTCTAMTPTDPAPDFTPTIAIEDFGTYALIDKKERAFEAGTTAGYASVISARHLQQTAQVKVSLNTVFGFNFAITDTTVDSEWVTVMIEVRHPDTVNYLGERSNGFKKLSAARLKADGRYHNGAFYIFSEPYEMVPGEWTIRVTYGESTTVSKRFTVK